MDYAGILAVAQELVADAGRVVSFQKLSAAPADAAKPWAGPGAPTVALTCDVPAVFVPPHGFEFGSMTLTKDLLARCEEVCLACPTALSFALETATHIVDNGARWRVQWVQTLKPGAVVVLYALGVSR